MDMRPRTSDAFTNANVSVPGRPGTYAHTLPGFSQQTFLLAEADTRYDAGVPLTPLAEAAVDWSEIHAVRLLGVALAVLLLLWAIRRMFGGK
jgi:hypothetical protein